MDDSSGSAPLSWRHRLLIFFITLLLWLLLVGTLDRQEIIAGLLVALAVTLLYSPRLAIFSGFRFSWLAPLYILHYLADFFLALLAANVDLARRVLTPSLPIRPEVVEVSTSLKSPLGKLLLANTITLTPGTLTIDVVGERLRVHWVYCPPGLTTQEVTEKIAARFERRLGRFLL